MNFYKRDEVYDATLEYFKGDTLASDVWVNKYALKETKDGQTIYHEKTPDDMHRRIAKELHRVESKYENPLSEDFIFDLIKNFEYIIPQGSPMAGIGNEKQVVSLSNCFVIGDTADSYGSIMKVDEEQIQLMKRRGGVGHDLSHIRPAGTPVKNSALTSTGLVPFMERYSNSTKEVAQGGRRGALMLTVSIKHPDSESFIDAKLEQGKITGANISVKVTDEFMKAAQNAQMFTQCFPIDSDNPLISKEIEAQKLWKKIIHNAWKSAEPGVLFWDTVMRESVPDCYADHGFTTVSTNPCIVGDSLIAVADGRNAVSIKQLALEGKDVPVYSTNNEGKVEIKWGRNPRLTGKKKEVWKLTLDDNSSFIATPDHKIYLNNNTYKELKDLLPNESISSFYSFNSNYGYRQIAQTGDKMSGGRFRNRRQYRLIHEFYNDTNIDYKLYSIHHKDFDNQNDNIQNLELMTRDEHKWLHSDRIKGQNNPYFRFTDDQKFKFASHPGEKNPKYINISNQEILNHARELYKKNGKFTSRMWLKYAKENGLPQSLWNEFRFKTFADFKNQVVNNHKVVKVEFHGYEDVYNITVDDNHNYNVITKTEDDKYITSGGICVKNCGEITLCPYDSCRLLAINLYSFVENPFIKDASFNWNKFKEYVIYAERFMDDIIDLEIEKIQMIIDKIESDPEIDEIKRVEREVWFKIMDMTTKGRRTGLGVTAEGDMLAALGLRYGTKEATDFSTEIHKNLALSAYKSSAIMAKERGSFPVYDYKRELKNPFIKRLKDADPELDKMLKDWGRRNISLLTIAPTGSVSILTQTTSGIEPAYLVSYKRRRKINPTDKSGRTDFIDAEGIKWEEYNVFHHKFETWLEMNGYNVDEVKEMKDPELKPIIEKSPYYKATSNDVDWIEKVRMQGNIQKYVDHSISVTVNLPNNATEEVVSNVYETGWRSGCKGITVYRDGSRQGVIMSNEGTTQNIVPEQIENNAEPRPKRLECDVVRFTNDKEKWIGFLGLKVHAKTGEKYPYELFTGLADEFYVPAFIDKGEVVKFKENDTKRYDFQYKDKDGYNVTMEGLSRAFNREFWNYSKLVSALLRHRMHLPSVINVIDSLQMDGDKGAAFGTWKAGVKRIIKKYINSNVNNEACPECGSMAPDLVYENGCKTCKKCGWSKCE
jgi:ribonucleotide reductase alpha subunit